MKITLGNESFQPNIGVPQGSVISPSLFNIYAASLLELLEGHGWNLKDILAFADDHLVIYLTKSQLRSAILLIRNWCESSNVALNPDKSGILEIVPMRGQPAMEIGAKFEGIPIVDEYRYLGMVIDGKPSGEKHIGKLFGWKRDDGKKCKGKIEFISAT